MKFLTKGSPMLRFPLTALLIGCLAAPAMAQHQCDPDNLVTRINGYELPGRVASLVDVEVMYNGEASEGTRLYVGKGTRMAGTRVGIHVHNFGGHTCVLSGAITIFMEGHAPKLFNAGTCYYMPANTYMAASNLGTRDAVLIDTFETPVGEDFITIVENCSGQ